MKEPKRSMFCHDRSCRKNRPHRLVSKTKAGLGLYKCVMCGSLNTAAFIPGHVNPARSGGCLKPA